MANITTYLNNIKNAVFGIEIRGSIHDGIKAINEEVETATQKQNTLSEQFQNLLNGQRNLINPSNINYDLIITQTGEESVLAGHYSTDFISVGGNELYTVTNILTSLGAWYDESKKFISRVLTVEQIGSYYTIKSPSNAKYVKLNFRYADVKPNYAGFFYSKVSSDVVKIEQLNVGSENYEIQSIEYKHIKNTNVRPTNLIDKTKIKTNTLLDANGNEVVAGNENIWTTDYMPIDDTQTYWAKELLARPGLWYDYNKHVIEWLPSNEEEPTKLIPPKGACYCRWVGDTSCPIETTMFIKGNEYPSHYIPYSDYDRFEISGLEITNETQKGKKYLVLGDSISANKTVAGIFYHDYLSDKLQLEKTNQAVSGSGWTVSSSTTDSLIDVINRLEGNYDLITIFAGTNDFGRTQDGVNSKSFGVYGDKTLDTFCGSVYYTLTKLIEKQVNADIVVITPLPRENQNIQNKYGKTLKDYRDIILKTCEDLSIPCIDLFKESRLYVFNETFKSDYMPDGLHPNSKGHKKIANKVMYDIEKYMSL